MLDIPHPVVADGQQTLNLERLKPWADTVDGRVTQLETVAGGQVSALPADPVDGQRAFVDTGQTGVVWQFRFSEADNVWMFVGGHQW